MKDSIYYNRTTKELVEEYLSMRELKASMVGNLYPRIVQDKMDEIESIYNTRGDREESNIRDAVYSLSKKAESV